MRYLRAAREAWFPLAYCVAFCVAVLALYLELR